jgi:hypothetical protein
MGAVLVHVLFWPRTDNYIIAAVGIEKMEAAVARNAQRMRWLLVSAAGAVLVTAASAQTPSPPVASRAEVWDLKLGTPASALPGGFGEYACGTNGGPPSRSLEGWGEFRRCRPEPSGLREVYFRYDDELEYWAKANELPAEIERYSGTRVYDFPVVLSALFDERGTLAGLRIVSDPRDTPALRDEAYTLRNFLTARFGRDGWSCTDLPPTEGEGPVGETFIKQDCHKTVEGTSLAALQTRYFRKKGQYQFDPHSSKETKGEFESTVHFELILTN